MDGNYADWLKREKGWIDEREKKLKKQTLLCLPLLVAACVIFFVLIGVLAGAGMMGVLDNVLKGTVIGIVAIPFFGVMVLPSFPSKRYMKNLKREIDAVLSPEERERFASQMLGIEGNIEEFSWIDDDKFAGKAETKVRITKDYALETASNGAAIMVQLQKVKKIDVDTREYTVTTRGGGFRIRQTVMVYLLYFYYQNPDEREESPCDKEFTFKEWEDREQVSHYIKQTLINVSL